MAVGSFSGSAREDAVDARGLHEDVGFDLHRFLGGGRVGGDERCAGAAGQDHDAAFFQVAPRAAADERLGDAVHAEGRHQPRLAVERFERVLQREAVDHRGQHAHVVGGRFLDAGVAGGELGAAEDIAAADHDGDLDAELGRSLDLRGDIDDFLHADAALAGRGKAFAGEFQEDAIVRAGAGHENLAVYGLRIGVGGCHNSRFVRAGVQSAGIKKAPAFARAAGFSG